MGCYAMAVARLDGWRGFEGMGLTASGSFNFNIHGKRSLTLACLIACILIACILSKNTGQVRDSPKMSGTTRDIGGTLKMF
jgi:hypothetical protein